MKLVSKGWHCYESWITLVAGVHYMYMREYLFQMQKSPVGYRYIVWSITVPLQITEVNLIFKAAGKPVGSMICWRRLGGTRAMLAFKYAGKIFAINAWIGRAIYMSG
jgi:hypothetical protein